MSAPRRPSRRSCCKRSPSVCRPCLHIVSGAAQCATCSRSPQTVDTLPTRRRNEEAIGGVTGLDDVSAPRNRRLCCLFHPRADSTPPQRRASEPHRHTTSARGRTSRRRAGAAVPLLVQRGVLPLVHISRVREADAVESLSKWVQRLDTVKEQPNGNDHYHLGRATLLP